MLHAGYRLFEFVSISRILKQAPVKYGTSFLYSETDDNDLTYFVVAQIRAIQQAIDQLHAYIDRKTMEVRTATVQLRALGLFNHRQAALKLHALKHPGHPYTFAGHAKSHNVVHQTARTDLLGLADHGLLRMHKRGRLTVFTAPGDLLERLKHLEAPAGDTG